jgi:lipoprotein Spr
MQKVVLYIIILAIASTSVGCKSVRKITNKDNSTNTSNRKKTKRKVEFIDGIEITPGAVVKSKHKPNTTKQGNIIVDVPNNLPATSNIKIEKTSLLQHKYAIILDTYIENIANLKLFNLIDDWWATNYCLGGTTKQCVDCSGFTGMLYREIFKANLPRTASEQYNALQKINRDELKEGDLVFFKASKRGHISHVGYYLCNNKFVHASTSNGVIIS